MDQERESAPNEGRKLDLSLAKTIIITTRNVDVKSINKLLLSLRSWECANESVWDNCQILRTKAEVVNRRVEADKPPWTKYENTEFEGIPLSDLESFMMSQHKDGVETVLYLVLDDRGIEEETIIIAERRINPKYIEWTKGVDLFLDMYNKVRVPWIEAGDMHANLAIANMGFDEFCEDGSMDEGWYTYRVLGGKSGYDENIKKRDSVLHELAKLDIA